MQAVLFDVGGTLLREDGYDLAAGVRALQAFPGLRAAALRPAAWVAELGAWKESVERQGHAGQSLARWLAQRLRPEARASLDLALLEERLWDAAVRMSPMPLAHEVLARARARGLALAAVSNTVFTGRTMLRALEAAGLAAPLSFLLSSAELPFAKPDVRIFRLACVRLGVHPERTWFVGDSWENDVVGASAAGLQPIWLSSVPGDGPFPCRRIGSLSELPPLLEG